MFTVRVVLVKLGQKRIIFFFSSRRRHTRSLRDWSSDVCSSDLIHAGDLISEICLAIEMGADADDIGRTIHPHPTLGESIGLGAEVFTGTCTDLPRSEERRVGKECRTRSWTHRYKKNKKQATVIV